MTETIPDFGMIQTEWRGALLESKAIAPGLSIQDLINIFCTARDAAEPGDELAGNPSKWPDVRGVKAVADAMLKAIYQGEAMTLRRNGCLKDEIEGDESE